MTPAALLLGALVAQQLLLPSGPPPTPAGPAPTAAARAPYAKLLARHAASAMLKQLALDDLVGKEPGWSVDLGAGTLRFGGGAPHPIQVLGTEAQSDRTWLWAWANKESDLPPAVVKAAERLRAIGIERQLQELFVKRFPLDEADGHQLSAIAVGLLGAGSYYRGPYGDGERQGAAFFLLTDFPRPEQVDRSPPRLIRAVELVLSNYPVDHREVVKGLAADLKAELVERPRALVLRPGKGAGVEFLLDEQGRVTKMSATAGR